MKASTLMAILKLVDLVAAAAQMAPGAKASYDVLSSRVQVMIDEGRDPTQEEWEEINARTDALINNL